MWKGSFLGKELKLLIIDHNAFGRCLHTYFSFDIFLYPFENPLVGARIRCPTWLYAKAPHPITISSLVSDGGNQMVGSM